MKIKAFYIAPDKKKYEIEIISVMYNADGYQYLRLSTKSKKIKMNRIREFIATLNCYIHHNLLKQEPYPLRWANWRYRYCDHCKSGRYFLIDILISKTA